MMQCNLKHYDSMHTNRSKLKRAYTRSYPFTVEGSEETYIDREYIFTTKTGCSLTTALPKSILKAETTYDCYQATNPQDLKEKDLLEFYG
jgi:hypothetical protein